MRASPRTWPSIRRSRLNTELLAEVRMFAYIPLRGTRFKVGRSAIVIEPAAFSDEVDPVCGMRVDPAKSAHRYSYSARLYHFCSDRCRARFAQEPEIFLAKRDGSPRTAPVGAIYTCPMHPQIREPVPGSCPICGMALEPVAASEDTDPNPELIDMTRRFWIAAALTVPVVVLEMAAHIPRLDLHHLISPLVSVWLQFVLATPVVLWAGLPFFARGWTSFRNRSLNMFSLIALGIGTAYWYSLVATVAPRFFPENLRHGGVIPVYYEAAAVITVLVLLGQVLELRAREQTGGAIRALLKFAPKMARRISEDGN